MLSSLRLVYLQPATFPVSAVMALRDEPTSLHATVVDDVPFVWGVAGLLDFAHIVGGNLLRRWLSAILLQARWGDDGR